VIKVLKIDTTVKIIKTQCSSLFSWTRLPAWFANACT